MLLALLGAGTSDAGTQTEAALSGATSVDARDNHTCARLNTGCQRPTRQQQPPNDSSLSVVVQLS